MCDINWITNVCKMQKKGQKFKEKLTLYSDRLEFHIHRKETDKDKNQDTEVKRQCIYTLYTVHTAERKIKFG